MSKDTKQVEKKIEKTRPKAKSSELSEKDLDKVAGGTTQVNNSRSNIKNNAVEVEAPPLGTIYKPTPPFKLPS